MRGDKWGQQGKLEFNNIGLSFRDSLPSLLPRPRPAVTCSNFLDRPVPPSTRAAGQNKSHMSRRSLHLILDIAADSSTAQMITRITNHVNHQARLCINLLFFFYSATRNSSRSSVLTLLFSKSGQAGSEGHRSHEFCLPQPCSQTIRFGPERRQTDLQE